MAKNTALEKLKEEHQKEEWALQSGEVKNKKQAQVFMILGGVHVANKIASSINSQVMNTLIEFQEKQMYLELGYENFVDFLSNSEYAPMSKSEFYRKRDIFLAEGGELFDLMNEIGVSMNVRKQLAAGNYEAIVIDGDKVRVGDDEADLSNMRMVKTLIESFAEEARKNKEDAGKKQEKLERAEQQVTKLAGELQAFKNPNDRSEETQIFDAYMRTDKAMEELIKAVKAAKKIDVGRYAETYIRSLYVKFCAVKKVFGREGLNLEDSQVEGEFKEVLSRMNDDELASMME